MSPQAKHEMANWIVVDQEVRYADKFSGKITAVVLRDPFKGRGVVTILVHDTHEELNIDLAGGKLTGWRPVGERPANPTGRYEHLMDGGLSFEP